MKRYAPPPPEPPATRLVRLDPIAAWWKLRVDATRRRMYLRGWDWAAGRLLEGETTLPLRLPTTPYDQGVFDAYKAWYRCNERK